jgi:putative serine protease PepD
MSNQDGPQTSEPSWTRTGTAVIDHAPSQSAPHWYGLPQNPVGPAAVTSSTQPQGNPRPKGRRRIAELSAVASLAALLASGGTYAAAQLTSQDTQPPSAASSSATLGRGTDSAPVIQADAAVPNWTATAAAVAPSVVSITATLRGGEAEGSGVIIDHHGHVLTNNHVVSGATSLTVTLADGRTYKATARGTDPSTDLAVVTIENAPASLTPIALGDSTKLKVGEPVMAIGNPLGLSGTVTTGIVSALNRPVTTSDNAQQSDPFGGQTATSEPVVTNAIQTSAAINPGNSGGALVNAAGQLVGINSAIASLGSSSSGQSGSIGIGFAIPVNEATNIAQQLIATGSAQHPYLGVTPVDGSASDGSATRAGAQVRTVGSGTGAAKAGLKPGDVIVAVDGAQVDSAESLVAQVRSHEVGSRVTITVLRGGQSIDVTAILGTKPAQ